VSTRNLRDISANLRHIANLLDSADLGELAMPMTVRVAICPGYSGDDAARMATVDQLATVTGKPADWRGTDEFAPYQTELTEGSWTLASHAYLHRPDPVKAENERLKAKIAEIERLASDG
jgi:hypothetical protein